MRLPDTAHTSRPWRIHDIAPDFTLLDVWAIPTPAGPQDFPQLVRLWTAFDATKSSSQVVRVLFAIRLKLGELLGWDDTGGTSGTNVLPLRDRVPADLLDKPSGPTPTAPFVALYLTNNEWAAETVNRTVHAVLHLGWVPHETGVYRGQLAVLVKPHGLLGRGYLAAIKPFRHLIVYPRMLAEIERQWRATLAAPVDPRPGHRQTHM
ncbi:DUF2867 domain-containing protein [Mycobacterium spongiae]|uniref:DUF2867 domain-containing protein n=1 Tax=Mycobacterium spongiae TaxID=886343 RepID=A0A975JU84_9MYCO|nr:DUF2867 domain-containing protein [Mycobacterium spongiae]QUR65792.1 DUF2867 domain-containing protein [Mycobacterium spongiae]